MCASLPDSLLVHHPRGCGGERSGGRFGWPRRGLLFRRWCPLVHVVLFLGLSALVDGLRVRSAALVLADSSQQTWQHRSFSGRRSGDGPLSPRAIVIEHPQPPRLVALERPETDYTAFSGGQVLVKIERRVKDLDRRRGRFQLWNSPPASLLAFVFLPHHPLQTSLVARINGSVARRTVVLLFPNRRSLFGSLSRRRSH